MEKIRIEYSIENNQVKVRYQHFEHFSLKRLEKMNALKNNAIWMQDVTLEKKPDSNNIDPWSPKFSIVSPVILNDKRVGYVVIDVELILLVSRLNYSPNIHFQPSLLDQNGYFIDSVHKDWLFGHVIESRQQYNLSQMYPETWERIQHQSSSYSFESNTLLVFSHVAMSPQQRHILLIMLDDNQLLDPSSYLCCGCRTLSPKAL
jgi:hypothetical protein